MGESEFVSGTQTFASIDGVNVSGFALQLRADTGKFAFTRLASDSSSAQVFHADAITAPSAGVWYNLLGVNDVANGQLLLYVNGILQSSVSYSGGWQATGATVIGAGKSGGTRTEFANGLIDEVRFFNSPLSAGAAAIVGTNGGGILTINYFRHRRHRLSQPLRRLHGRYQLRRRGRHLQ